MNIPWYYASKGERLGPISWEEIRQAVEEKRLGPDDYIWSPSFGETWRKAETLTGLFPPPEPPPITQAEESSANANSVPTENIERAVEALLLKEPFQSPFATDSGPTEAYDKADTLINCRKAFLQAWLQTKQLIFVTFSFRRWFFLSLCVMLTLLNPPNPFVGFISNESDSSSAKQIDRMQLKEVTESGVFKLTLPIDEKSQQEFQNQLSDDWITSLGSAMRETAVATKKWFNSGEHRHHLLFAVMVIIFVYAIGIWFSARGNAMFFARLYRPDALIFATWIEADKPAGALFKGMIVIRLISLTALLLVLRHAINALAALPSDTAVSEKMVLNILSSIIFVLMADRMVMRYVKDFVTPHIVLTTPKFIPAFVIALQSTGFWFIRFLLLLFIAYFALGSLIMIIGLVFGMGIQLASVLIFTSPLIGALLTLPIHLIRRLWTLNIIFQLNPALRKAIPRSKLIRIVK